MCETQRRLHSFFLYDYAVWFKAGPLNEPEACQHLSLNRKLAIWLSSLSSKLSEYLSLCSPSAGVEGTHSHAFSVSARHRIQDFILAELLLPMKSAGQSQLSSF